MRTFSWTVLGVCVALSLQPRLASAQETCTTDGGTVNPSIGLLEQFFPGDREVNVPIDGFVRLRYIERAPPRPFIAVSEADTGTPVAGTATLVRNEVHWHAAQPFRPDTAYRVHVADASSSDNEFGFRTGFARSSDQPPVFDGVLEGPTSVRSGETDICGDPEAVEITLRFRRARDNGWPATDLEYVIFQTRGPGISGPVERARERGRLTGSASSTEQQRSFRLSSANAAGPVCFNIQALDAYGRADGNTVERCLNPASGNFFNGCSLRPGTTTSSRAAALSLLAAVALLARRRPRR